MASSIAAVVELSALGVCEYGDVINISNFVFLRTMNFPLKGNN
jgi:hypothetical protein